MATPNKFRREIELALNGNTYAVRPTFDKMARLESRFGAAVQLMKRVGDNGATQAELAQIVGVMLRGEPNAPREQDIPRLVFEQGSATVGSSIVDFIVAGVTPSEASAAKADADAEADAGNP
jgi:hypothetical protein